MKILGIETSCDETACAVVENGQRVLSNVIASQIDLHAKTGGVVPEVAAREHILQILPVIDEALAQAGCGFEDLAAVAVTRGPGLIGSLLVGTETASAISLVKNVPLVGVHHIHGHIYSAWLDQEDVPQFPILVLTVSGGHNDLVLFEEHGKMTVLGETRDDAAGEAFDKVARMLGMAYPGGPQIAKAALNGDAKCFDFPRAMLDKGNLDFSFSGLKSAVRRELREEMDKQFKADLAASFQEAVVEVLVQKLMWALEAYPQVKEVHLVGGVSANLRLRELIKQKLAGKIPFRYPLSLAYCTDNAAMIAAAGYFNFRRGEGLIGNLVPSSNFEL